MAEFNCPCVHRVPANGNGVFSRPNAERICAQANPHRGEIIAGAASVAAMGVRCRGCRRPGRRRRQRSRRLIYRPTRR